MTPGYRGQAPRIVAPVCSLAEAEAALAAGADELYCGAMFDEWAHRFGETDLLSRRQGRAAHLRDAGELRAVARLARSAGRLVALTLNARYTRDQEPAVLDLARQWEDWGGQAVVVSDAGILLELERRGSRLRRFASLLTNVGNSAGVAFFAELGVSRVVVPRDLAVREIRHLARASVPMELEAVAMYQKCEFVDGCCGFYHGVRLPSDVPAEFEYPTPGGRTAPVVESCDPDYEGHGCQLCWRTDRGAVRHLPQDDFSSPACSACQAPALARAGVGYLKIAGRAYPSAHIVSAIRFLREACALGFDPHRRARASTEIRRLYAETFGSDCGRAHCYYTP